MSFLRQTTYSRQMNESELSAASNDAVQVVEFLIQVLPDWARIKVFQYQEFYSSISEGAIQ